MGAKSTVDITREAALRAIKEHIDHVPNEDLGLILEEVNDSTGNPLGYLYNFTVRGSLDSCPHCGK